MHTKEIAEHIFQEFHVRVNKWSLGTQLWRHVKNHPDSPFYDVASLVVETPEKK